MERLRPEKEPYLEQNPEPEPEAQPRAQKLGALFRCPYCHENRT